MSDIYPYPYQAEHPKTETWQEELRYRIDRFNEAKKHTRGVELAWERYLCNYVVDHAREILAEPNSMFWMSGFVTDEDVDNE